jgi:hypothetical protein
MPDGKSIDLDSVCKLIGKLVLESYIEIETLKERLQAQGLQFVQLQEQFAEVQRGRINNDLSREGTNHQ